jgi:predicted MFS family arabinose efflux permease
VAIEDRATAMGIFQATYAIGMMSGPIVSGQVADNISLDVVFYMVAAVSLAAGFAGFQRRIPARSTQSDDTR